jgi:hypothetical protein
MPLPEENAAELEGMRRRLLEMLLPLQRDEDSQDLDEQVLRQSLWSAVQGLEAVLRDEHDPVGLDLHQSDEATRRILHDFVIWDYFTPRALADPGHVTVPRYTPEECGLRVFFEHGRWLVTWLELEKDNSQPEAKRRELLVFEKDEDGHLVLAEV